MIQPCRHCKRVKSNRGRGLCFTCHQTPSVRALYPVSETCTRGQDWHEPTMAELDAMIAEQLPTMPTGKAAMDSPGDSLDRIRVLAKTSRKTRKK